MKKGFTLILVLILCAVSGACAEKGLVAAFPEEAGESSIAQMVADTLELPLLESAEDTGSAANLMLGDPECILIGTQNILITGLQGYTERDLRQAMTPVCTLAVSPLFLVMDRDVAEELGIIGFDSFRSYISEEQDDCCFARHLDADPVDRAVTRLAYELDVLTDLFPEDEVPDALRDGDALAGVLSGADMADSDGDWLPLLCLGAERSALYADVPCAAEAGLTPCEGILIGLYTSVETSAESVESIRAAMEQLDMSELPAGYTPFSLSGPDFNDLVRSMFTDYMAYMTADGLAFYEE